MQKQARTESYRNVALIAARIVAGVVGAVQLAGVFFFTLLARDEAVWLGPWVDVPVIGVMVFAMVLKLICALWPGLSDGQRILIGLSSVAIGVVMTLIKIPLYSEPEGVTFLVAEAVLAGLLLLARRAVRTR